MKRAYKDKAAKFRKIALERIIILFGEAKNIFSYDPKLSDRYVFLARKIAMKYKVRLPNELKRKFCRRCHSFFMPGKNCRIRTHEGKVVYFCMKCKNIMRFPYVKERKARRKTRK
ncbi:ribonuclease P [Candidatus Woesearchaeota archaeon]|nr:ribonuclease P [Candidatus Woesearchaeota archaeon]